MGSGTKVYEAVILLVGFIYAWPISQINIHPEETKLSFDTDSQRWFLTLSEELSTGVAVSFLITLVYGLYWFRYQAEFKRIR